MPPSSASRPSRRRGTRRRWVQRGRLAVMVRIEVVFLDHDPSDRCFEPDIVGMIDEITTRAEAGDLDDLQTVGRVLQEVGS